ncbi:hypothetical protein J1C51_23550 [Chromobacterium haemolyticum]|uniref:hypothetical protein n=1 Tax=Chromobacterium haemolyticum TaxID=394935 RepID=UPI001A912417|nr:hypothetical protein [Chromobacterium haemolyticum]MBO0501753.1 hypothetical protein [Chromobacterium haemolyticum]
MEFEEFTGVPDWLLRDVSAQAARLDDGQFVRDLGEIGRALCEADADTLKTILADSKTAARIERELEVVLPFYLPLLADSINRRGEETHLTTDELATLLLSHGKPDIVLQPKLLLESGRFGFALMQAAAALADLDDILAGPWYLSLKELLQGIAVTKDG